MYLPKENNLLNASKIFFEYALDIIIFGLMIVSNTQCSPYCGF